MYSKTHYNDIRPRTQQLVDEMMEANGGKLPPGGHLICAKKASAELYEMESDEVNAEVLARIQEQAKIKEEKAVIRKNRTPEQYLE